MIAYKFLSEGAVGLFSRHAWPTPTDDAPGEWVRVKGEIQPCLNGIHACTPEQLVDWLDDELWEIELEDPVEGADGDLVARAGRLVRRVERWNDECARAFIGHCVDYTASLAAQSLAQAGHTAEAETLNVQRAALDAEATVTVLARNLNTDGTSPVLFMADVARLQRGGRPELDHQAPSAEDGGPTPAALAATIGYVCAHLAAQLAEQQTPGAYGDSFARERLRQSAWLAEKLQVGR